MLATIIPKARPNQTEPDHGSKYNGHDCLGRHLGRQYYVDRHDISR
jgi:hypothetical protein